MKAPLWTLGVSSFGLALTVALCAAAQPEKTRTPEQQEKLKKRDDLQKKAEADAEAGQVKKAAKAAKQALALETEVFGAKSASVAG